MPQPRSFLERLEVDEAKRSHSCRHSDRHRIARGDKRLKVRSGRSYQHYCAECAAKFIDRDLEKLERIRDLLIAL